MTVMFVASYLIYIKHMPIIHDTTSPYSRLGYGIMIFPKESTEISCTHISRSYAFINVRQKSCFINCNASLLFFFGLINRKVLEFFLLVMEKATVSGWEPKASIEESI
ncbi:hypothetical protein EUGRSUZ_C01381 [Eucalyptus grandis]|uniref:Uncharacterized protein n=2 Tax=Eucalyptus grandis TaxID=71139 RepID=A0ACC3LD61_EUCGR|nr:hypothetical protein EUGRSUZ_C01381 [Eucalyptus grandis]